MMKTSFRLLVLLLGLLLPAVGQAQFRFTTNNGAITITLYTGSGGEVIIPAMTNGLPVTSIGDSVFQNKFSLTSVTIPNSVTNIGNSAFNNSGLCQVVIPSSITRFGDSAFSECGNLTNVILSEGLTGVGSAAFKYCSSLPNVVIPNSFTSIKGAAFYGCIRMTSVVIPDSVTNIEWEAFRYCSSLTNVTFGTSVKSIYLAAFLFCSSLTSVTIPDSVTNIEESAFGACENLSHIYFKGNAPVIGPNVFIYTSADATVYYLPGKTNWSSPFGDIPAVLWNPQAQINDANFGVQTNQFGFNVSWASGQTVVVDGCTDLANPVWTPLQTNTLTGDAFYFSDSQWSNYPARLYRLRSP
ncbi:MAG: leucine-rich repeat domain-containing protein [Verrucomicrobia bacterium]|nr:leucine-rich repeat domain-containing protein [Verrucomicrobiota bacterium]